MLRQQRPSRLRYLQRFVLICFFASFGWQCSEPTTSISLKPDKACDPRSHANIPSVGTLFEGGADERICMVIVWRKGDEEKRSSELAMLAADGSIKGWSADKKAFDGALTLPNPKGVLSDASQNTWQMSMHMIFLKHQSDASKAQPIHESLCQQAGVAGFQCFGSADENPCWFMMNVPPNLPADSKLKLEITTKSCKPCVPEICDNGQDDDCDGKTDGEDAECSGCRPGQTRPCATVVKAQRNIGACKDGEQKCDAAGVWGKCEGEVKPTKESCDGKDQDCDGQIDNGAADCCELGAVRACFSGKEENAGIGQCKQGSEICVKNPSGGGKWSGDCIGAVEPANEECDGLDNDCDGKTDEDLTQKCYDGAKSTRGVGACEDGIQKCQNNGRWGSCFADVQPKEEICNGLDDDCDGTTDEDFRGKGDPCPVPNAQGPCAQGILVKCEGGKPVCESSFTKTTENCGDGIDNDCDGKIDGGCACTPGQTQSCYTGDATTRGKGACQDGTQTCKSDSTWGDCVGEGKPSVELCDNIDNDCDGSVDETLSRSCYSGKPGTDQNAPCKKGTQTCSAGKWGACQGEVTPKKETCDGQIDENCDGNVDEICVCTPNSTKPCYSGQAGTAGVGTCKAGTETCKADSQWGECKGEVKPATETCDGKDNDCDGQVDNGLRRPCYTGPGGTKDVGICKSGVEVCNGGKWSFCRNETKPASGPDDCDGQDNDCDGKTDEDCVCRDGQTQDCYNGTAGTDQNAPCKKGTQTCASGNWGSCQGEVTPAAKETKCDNKDEDCNGQIDDGLSRDCYSGPSGTDKNAPCKKGTQTCTAGSWGTCNGEVTPGTETCNNKDDDCDGKIDNQAGGNSPLERSCYTGPSGTEGKGECKAGVQTCNSGNWSSTCTGQVTPANRERCNGKDDDCDGKVDNYHDPNVHCPSQGCDGDFVCDSPSKDCVCP